MENLQEKTRYLEYLISNAKKSAIDTYEAGKMLDEIRKKEGFLPQYKSFNEYTQKSFCINESTADKYIEIYKKIPHNYITENILVTHLYLVTEMKDESKRIQMLKAMNSIEKSGKSKKHPYDYETVLSVKQIIEESKDGTYSDKDTTNLLQELTKKKQEQSRRKFKLSMGSCIKESKIKGIEDLYTNNPVDEQGLVGLFCTIFHLIKYKPFLYYGRHISFSKILYIRSSFPDAKIEVVTDDEKTDHLNIEFEFESMRYLRHKHDKAKDACHIIICWKNDWDYKKEIERPKILSVQELIKEGNIILI